MLDRDLAELYGVETRTLNQRVKRNLRRFPSDFMFQMTKEDIEEWKSQIVISNSIKMGLRKSPKAFTLFGVAMLSSVLNSETAIDTNIDIMRAFVEYKTIKDMVKSGEFQELQEKLVAEAESKIGKSGMTDEQLKIYSTIGGTPHLDGQYTVFGEVEEGLDVVEMIQNSATGRGDRPVDDIEMKMVVIE